MSNRFREPALIAVGVGTVLLAVLAFIDLQTSLLGYLCIAVAFTAVPAGALAVLLTSYLVRGVWTDTLHVPLVATAVTAPGAGLLFVPILLGLAWIYHGLRHQLLHPARSKLSTCRRPFLHSYARLFRELDIAGDVGEAGLE